MKKFINKKPFLIAEISANHCGDFNLAKIKCAKLNNADAVKLQTYTADTMTVNSNKKYFKIKKAYGRVILFGIYMTRHIRH